MIFLTYSFTANNKTRTPHHKRMALVSLPIIIFHFLALPLSKNSLNYLGASPQNIKRNTSRLSSKKRTFTDWAPSFYFPFKQKIGY
ncbi:Putative membrane protein [Zobellia galactanivorans]|uniref:Putative membrane protein n=1 Tax=Zobellia galactanivorans (strain DSM 12802 / CCUG 47099 / CIP 106680 / NCIMB 13871 / Dsij) TaxID=63186 RepID=G0L2Q4_ZOBGA|nr:Putative membrane protein [Zobellia galactanivorans]